MGTVAFDFLADSVLFNDERLANEFESETDEELQSEIGRYRDFVCSHADTLHGEVDDGNSSLVVLSDEPFRVEPLAQAALYVNQYLVKDPLAALARDGRGMSSVMNEYLGMKPSILDRKRLSQVIRGMRLATPMVAANFLKFLPPAVGDEPDPNRIPINYSANHFDDVLPLEILKLFREASQIRAMRRIPGGFVVEDKLYPTRAVNISFKGHSSLSGFMYLLWEQEVISEGDEEGHFQARLSLPETVPEATYFQAWTRQSVNQAAAALFSRAQNDIALASSLGAVVSTRSDLLFKAVQKVFKPGTSVPMRTANVFLNLELPFLSGISIPDLMRLRQDEGEAFQRFRLLLDQKMSGLRAAPGTEEAKQKAALAVHELTEVKKLDLDDKIKGVRDKLLANAVIAGIGFAAAVQTGGVSLLATAAGLAEIGKTVVDYRQDVKRHPAYFLWKALSKRSKTKNFN